VSERVAAGVGYREMLGEAGYVSAFVVLSLMCVEIGRVAGLPTPVVAAAVVALTGGYAWFARSAGRPIYILLILLMVPLAITELSTDSWITALMEPQLRAVGLQAGWLLVYTAGLMFVIRLFAGSVVQVLNPVGALALASALAAAGLSWLSVASGAALLAAATLYGIGKSFFWGTSLALVSERFPKGGAVTVNVVAGVGMLAAGIIGASLLGTVQDRAIAEGLVKYDAVHGARLAESYLGAPRRGAFGEYRGLDQGALTRARQSDRAVVSGIVDASKQHALHDVAKLPMLMLVIYLGLLGFFRMRGGYRRLELAPGPAGL
jgi:DHA2 family metal-tetracycline-proton antiporter-like MFS transporter